MPRNKNGHNPNHEIKKSKNKENGRTFVDNSNQQEHLLKLLLRKEKKQSREDNRQRAEQEAAQRADQRDARENARVDEVINDLRRWDERQNIYAPNLRRQQEQQNRPPLEVDGEHLAEIDNRRRFAY